MRGSVAEAALDLAIQRQAWAIEWRLFLMRRARSPGYEPGAPAADFLQGGLERTQREAHNLYEARSTRAPATISQAAGDGARPFLRRVL